MPTKSPANGSNQVVLYKADDGTMQIDVRLEDETIWLSLNQISTLFQRDKSVISRHIRNIFATEELGRSSTVAFFATVQKEGAKAVKRNIEYYNLDVIISVGYRVNSKRGTQFRIWATNVLRKHLIEGYTLHQKRLLEKGTKELEQALALVSRTKGRLDLSPDEAKGLLDIVTQYAQTWLLLRKYDDDELDMPAKLRKASYALTYDDALSAIQSLRKDLATKGESSDLFGLERQEMLQAIIGNLRQTFDRHELYPTVEEKAAHLLYFVIKDHPFIDGNKRIAVLLFLTFLQRNNVLPSGQELSGSTLVALALLIAESAPKEKETMLRLVLHFLVS